MEKLLCVLADGNKFRKVCIREIFQRETGLDGRARKALGVGEVEISV